MIDVYHESLIFHCLRPKLVQRRRARKTFRRDRAWGFPAFRVYKGLPEDFGTRVIDEAVTCGYKILVHGACYRLFRRPCVNVAQEDQRSWTEYRKRETGGGLNTNEDGKMTIAGLDDVPEQKENEADKGDSSGGATNDPEAEIVKELHNDSRQISINVET